MSSVRVWALLGLMAALLALAAAQCPYGHDRATVASDTLIEDINIQSRHLLQRESPAAATLDVQAVKKDLEKTLYDSQDFWPADFGYYGGLFVRLAWHCAGSYRKFDGRGGCDGGRIRFAPEALWEDNGNLDKARKLLEPIKKKYGKKLSWGDLIILAGDTAIEVAGGPRLGFCAGRIDDNSGRASRELGPNSEQQLIVPCEDNGHCKPPLGPTTLGLIYVNPEGPMGNPDPKLSAPQIRSTFYSMGMNDSETVALIGGGHALGKAHGACPKGPCGRGKLKGKGPNTLTSGFEGAWTETPTKWSNDYFENLLEYKWELTKSPAGKNQWKPKNADTKIFMLTADVALLHDDKYLDLVTHYAKNPKAFDHAFKHAWYKLTTRDMGPHSRCVGKYTLPPQEFQCPITDTYKPNSKDKANTTLVRMDIAKALTDGKSTFKPDQVDGKPYFGALFSALTWSCASTFRKTDYMGGCNGARIRFSPQKNFASNKNLNRVLAVLKPIKQKYSSLSYADLIVLAGKVAMDQARGSWFLDFCEGRSDAKSGCEADAVLAPRRYPSYKAAVVDNPKVMGLTANEYVSLAARLRSPTQQKWLGYSGSWTSKANTLSNEYFKVLLNEKWVKTQSASGNTEYKAEGKDLWMMPEDIALKEEYPHIVKEFAKSDLVWMRRFSQAWNKLVNADRYKDGMHQC